MKHFFVAEIDVEFEHAFSPLNLGSLMQILFFLSTMPISNFLKFPLTKERIFFLLKLEETPHAHAQRDHSSKCRFTSFGTTAQQSRAKQREEKTRRNILLSAASLFRVTYWGEFNLKKKDPKRKKVVCVLLLNYETSRKPKTQNLNVNIRDFILKKRSFGLCLSTKLVLNRVICFFLIIELFLEMISQSTT